MQLFNSGRWGLVLDREPRLRRGIGSSQSSAAIEDADGACRAHLVLYTYVVDDHGHIALTPTLPINDLYTLVALFKAELDGVLAQDRRRVFGSQAGLATDAVEWGGMEGGGPEGRPVRLPYPE